MLFPKLARLKVQIQDVVHTDLGALETADLFDQSNAQMIARTGFEVLCRFVVVDFLEAVFEFEFADQGHGDEVCACACVAFGPDDYLLGFSVAYDERDVGVITAFLEKFVSIWSCGVERGVLVPMRRQYRWLFVKAFCAICRRCF